MRGQRTRDQLIASARTVFERDGFLHARIADICDLAGTSHASFYTYFVAKEEIFNEVVDSVEVDLLAIEAVPEGADPMTRIRAANRHYLETYRDNAGIMKVIEQVSTFDPSVRETRVRRTDVFADAIERRTRAYQEQGIADPRVDPRYAAQALGGMVASFADRLYTQGQEGEFDLDTTVEQLTILWSNALGIPPDVASAAHD
jgi:AcrR family transcriptional regulator